MDQYKMLWLVYQCTNLLMYQWGNKEQEKEVRQKPWGRSKRNMEKKPITIGYKPQIGKKNLKRETGKGKPIIKEPGRNHSPPMGDS